MKKPHSDHPRFRLATTLYAAAAFCVSLSASAAQTPSSYTTATRYNANRQVTAVILPWDGVQYQATRNIYDAYGRLIRTEKGALSAWKDENADPAQWTGFTLHLKTVYTYDNLGRKITQAVVAQDGTTTTLTQLSYDALNQVICSAVRMNPAVYAQYSQSPPSVDACTLGTAGADGPDRITHFDYNGYGQITQEKRAYGTSVVQTYITNTYIGAQGGLLTDQTDANGNRTHLEYDAQSRVEFMRFPSKTTAGQYNSNDYEQYGYDLNGNRTTLRKRDTKTITYGYDNLSRVVTESYPAGTTAPNVFYGYDLRNLQVYARFGSSSVSSTGITTTYDGFGNVATSATNQGTAARTLSYQYDLEGRRLRVTHPDNQYFTYAYDGLNRLTTIKENGGTTLLTMGYDNQNRPQTLARGANVTSTTYGYDLASRLSSLNQDLVGTSYDETRSFGRNAANQINSRTLTNTVYSFTQLPALPTSYLVNGLNQYTQLTTGSSTSPAYDDNGNMVWDGSTTPSATTYFYDILNRMTGSSGGKTVNISYDPKGRLFQTSGGTSGTTQFLYDGDALVGEYDGAGALKQRYVHGGNVDQPLVSYTGAAVSSTNRQYLHADHQGSVMSVVDASGNALQVNTYDPYGVPAAGPSGNATRFQYTGQIMLPDLGLYHYKARVYNPTLGRFMQTDPIGYKDDYDLYTYVGNDPMDRNDPSGMTECRVDANGCKHFGTPQKTDANDTTGHAKASAKVGEQFSKQGATEVHYNRPLSASTGVAAAGAQRPDVLGIFAEKRGSTVEIVSPSQTVASQVAKGEVMQSQLNAIGRAGNASTLTIAEALSGAAARAAAPMGVLSPIIRSIEVGKLEREYGRSAGVAGLYYAAGYIDRSQLIQMIQPRSPD